MKVAREAVFVVASLCLLLANSALATLSPRHEVLIYDPVANPKAIIQTGNARFTILTPQLIRMEYSASGKFEDRATVAFLNRNLTVPIFTSKQTATQLTIATSDLTLEYTLHSEFSSKTLAVRSSNFKGGIWRFGDANHGNLLGTIKSLDELSVISLNCTVNNGTIVHDEKLHCRWGLISRDGWAVVDDTPNYALTKDYWWDGPDTDTHDLYLFGHGSNYRQALTDFTKIAGKIAMVPRYTSGIWWSRWYNLDNHDVQGVVEDYKTRDLPLDVFILDMDWHTKYAWGGYTFDHRLFHIPESTMKWLAARDIHVGVNLHDDNGVLTSEVEHDALAKYMGLPSDTGDIPFSIVNATYVYGLEDIVLQHVADQGVDFWWIDWQQGGKQGGAAGGYQNPTIWLNHIRSTDHLRRGQPTRGLILARWGGFGSHRYQVGFSGDVKSLSWQNLAFQPYFSMTSTNVAFGFWSHDLVGPHTDHELHTRWLQWGAYSAIFRTHDRGMSAGGCANNDPPDCAIVEVWNVPKLYYKTNRAVMKARVALTPYTYTAQREAYDTGLSIIRPLYYDYPKLDSAYLADSAGKFSQYMFGPDMMVNPILRPANASNMANATIWIPPGKWIEKDTGVLYDTTNEPQGRMLTKAFDLREVPVFVKSGAIIPQIPVVTGDTLGLTMRQYEHLVFEVYLPGSESGKVVVYEDDGISTDYVEGRNMWTTAEYTYSRDLGQLGFSVSSEGKGYAGFPTSRVYEVRVVNGLPVKSATVNGDHVAYNREGGPNTWRYDGFALQTIVETKAVSGQVATIMITFVENVDDTQMSGLKGMIQHASWAKSNFDESRVTPGAQTTTGGKLEELAARGEEMTYLAGTDVTQMMQVLKSLPAGFDAAMTEVLNMPHSDAFYQLWDTERQDNVLCGSNDCKNSNMYYQQLRVEGYPPLNDKSCTVVKLNDYWNADVTDNYATTAGNPGNGYANADFGDGTVCKNKVAGTIPLHVYYNADRHDYLTVASAEGLAYAVKYNYSLVSADIGYVFTSAQAHDARWEYSYHLLLNAMN